jgi:hypothetical protein
MSTSKSKSISSINFDKQFEDGDVFEHLDISSAKARYPVQRISIDFPKTILSSLDEEAAKIGVTRTSLIKMWIAQHLSNQAA